MSLIICPDCRKNISDKAKFCPNCGCPINTPEISNIITTTIPLSPVEDRFSQNEVIKHLSYAAEIEKTIFTYNNLYEHLASKIASLGIRRKINQPKGIEPIFPIFFAIPIFFIALIILSINSGDFWGDLISIISVVLIFFNSELLARAGTALLIAIGIVIAIFIISLISEIFANISDKKQYKIALQIDEQRLRDEEQAKIILINQQTIIQEQLNKNKDLLTKLYHLGIIYPKYRHMAAVNTILEYFQSGICSQLTGQGGAYDRYEYDEKLGIIIGKMDVIIDKLEAIKQTQTLLYDAIKEANEISQKIYSQSEKMITNGEKIAENTALIAYNTNTIKRNTSISTYIDVFGR